MHFFFFIWIIFLKSFFFSHLQSRHSSQIRHIVSGQQIFPGDDNDDAWSVMRNTLKQSFELDIFKAYLSFPHWTELLRLKKIHLMLFNNWKIVNVVVSWEVWNQSQAPDPFWKSVFWWSLRFSHLLPQCLTKLARCWLLKSCQFQTHHGEWKGEILKLFWWEPVRFPAKHQLVFTVLSDWIIYSNKVL